MKMLSYTVRVEHLADIKFGDLGANTGWLTFSLANPMASIVKGEVQLVYMSPESLLCNLRIRRMFCNFYLSKEPSSICSGQGTLCENVVCKDLFVVFYVSLLLVCRGDNFRKSFAEISLKFRP